MCVCRCASNLLNPPEAIIVIELTIFHHSNMAPPHMIRASKPAFQPRVGGKPVASRVEKNKCHAKTAKLDFFANALTFRPKEAAPTDIPPNPMMQDSPEPAPTDPVSEEPLIANPVNQNAPETALTARVIEESVATDEVNQDPHQTPLTDGMNNLSLITDVVMQNSPETTLVDQVSEQSPTTDATSATQTADDEEEPLPVLVEKRFNLQDAIPKNGLQFRWEIKGKRAILGRWKAENAVAKALYSDMDIIHKAKAQGVISPVIHQATKMIECGTLHEISARIGNGTDAEGDQVWNLFLGRLWANSCKKWPRRLSRKQFINFFSTLVEARWTEIVCPKLACGEKPGLLVQHLSLFLDAANAQEFSWANGGDILNDYEE